MSEGFQLEHQEPRPAPEKFESSENTRQQPLFSGLDCLPGQMDLFPTDGRDEEPA